MKGKLKDELKDKPLSWFFIAEDGCVTGVRTPEWSWIEEDEDGEKHLLVPIPRPAKIAEVQEVICRRHGAKVSGEGFYDEATGIVQFTAGGGGLQ